jgi:transcriptional regulator with XRE-family HTH domain
LSADANGRHPIHFLREWRVERGLSQAALAKISGASPDQIGRFEAGHREIRLGMMLRLAKALAITPNDFFEPPPGKEDEP